MENLPMDYNAANEKFQDMITKVKQHENQMNILMDLMKIPKDERNFVELKNKIEKLLQKKTSHYLHIKSNPTEMLTLWSK